MNCRKCRALLPDGANFCPACGAKVSAGQRPKSRGNGQGTVIRRGNGWTAIVSAGYTMAPDGTMRRKRRSKGGFKTKKEAIAYLPILAAEPEQKKSITFKALYDRWLPDPSSRAGHHELLQSCLEVLCTCMDGKGI